MLDDFKIDFINQEYVITKEFIQYRSAIQRNFKLFKTVSGLGRLQLPISGRGLHCDKSFSNQRSHNGRGHMDYEDVLRGTRG